MKEVSKTHLYKEPVLNLPNLPEQSTDTQNDPHDSDMFHDSNSQASECSDHTVTRGTFFQTRLSVNFFMPHSNSEADIKLFIAAKSSMAKMAERDKSVNITMILEKYG